MENNQSLAPKNKRYQLINKLPEKFSSYIHPSANHILLQSNNQIIKNSNIFKQSPKAITNTNKLQQVIPQKNKGKKLYSKYETKIPEIQSFKAISNRSQELYEKNDGSLSYTSHNIGQFCCNPSAISRKNSIMIPSSPTNTPPISIPVSNPIFSSLSSQNFTILKVMGKGKYGNVYLVQDRQTGFLMALKAISKKIIKQKKIQDQITQQIKIQFYLKHPGIIELYGMFHDSENLYLLMQLGCDGQLFNLVQTKKVLKEETVSFLTRNLLEIVSFLHGQRVFHRDLKPQNIVMVMGQPKICDFGWSAYTSPFIESKMRQTFCGTPLYFSPQLLLGRKYDEKVDLWAIGVMAYQFLIGKSPFGLQNQNDLQNIIKDQIDFNTLKPISYYCKQFISKCLVKNPQKRSTSKQLLQTWFIRKYLHLETCEQLCESFPVLLN